jgi:hypothetical protein
MPPNADEKRGYELRDVDVGALMRPALVLFVVIVLTFVSMYWMQRLFEWRHTRADQEAAELARQWPREAPPEPRLQMDPPSELARLRAEEEKQLDGYAWVDRGTGVVRIPVERAIDILAERGLPAREEGGR